MKGEVARPAEALILFDIDGTLIRRAGPHHREALIAAVRRVTGVETTLDNIPVQGMLDPDIVRAMLRNAGVSQRVIGQVMPDVIKHAQAVYLKTCPNLHGKVCPGVRSLLRRIQRRNIPAALVTGNLTRIAWRKMEHAGLREFFRFGAFAEMAKTRTQLARMAIQQARKRGCIADGARISLIGDHPNDIQAAKMNNVRSIAVATGIATREELAACSPDLLLDDLRSLKLDMLL
ncbi:MAG TPA: HAD family hydrolase [Bryobacteraceae bacterium]|nr:HAD family hydrolase [Bryobacteraceae bacterium]